MKKWYHFLFVAVCLAVLLFLLRAPEVTTPRLPRDANHEDRKQYERCPACHEAGSDVPMPDDHLAEDGVLRPDHAKCYFCHKPEDS